MQFVIVMEIDFIQTSAQQRVDICSVSAERAILDNKEPGAHKR